jgi:cytoskeletal protein CcmA (bactofilin family)
MRPNTSHNYHVSGPWDRPPAASNLNHPKPPSRSVLDCSVRLTGDLWSEGDVQIDGHLCGNISCVQLIVSKDAAVTGVIIAQEAVIRGKTSGIIRANRVLLQETARVESEIIYKSLAVDEGASFDGIARPSPQPLEEDFTLSPTPEARQKIGLPYTASSSWTRANCGTAGEAGPLAAAQARRQLPAPIAAAERTVGTSPQAESPGP